MSLRVLVTIPELAQEFCAAPKVEARGGDALLKFDFEREDGSYGFTGILFEGCVKSRFTAEARMTRTEDIHAYNAVAVEETSDWTEGSGLFHYKVFFDGFGLYEFAAASFVKLGELEA